MKLKFGLAHLIPLLLVLLAVPATAQTNLQKKDKDLPHFFQVNENLYRGAQPTIEGVRKLAALGIKTILSLRGDGKLSIDEAKAALDAGMQFKSVPMPDLGRPKDEQVDAVLEIINDQQNWPVFVHCKHGEDRTGVIIACYRMSKEGKTAQEALKEAKQYGMSRFQFGMKDFIGDYYKRKVPLKPKSASGSTVYPLAHGVDGSVVVTQSVQYTRGHVPLITVRLRDFTGSFFFANNIQRAYMHATRASFQSLVKCFTRTASYPDRRPTLIGPSATLSHRT